MRVFKDLEVFRDVDAPWCPEMVVIPAGEFLMGSPESERGRYDDEGPQHRVTIGSRFALGRYPVTVGEYRKFVEVTSHRHEGGMHVWTGSNWKQDASKSWQDPGFAQADRHPVVGVSWHDAVTYCEWLANETGQPYRLPSEAEWEYATRAGTTTRFSWGDAITPQNANYAESWLHKTTEVGAYPANPWGLYDVHGNVWEWVEDVWHNNYEGAPTDSSAWTESEGNNSSSRRVTRGGAWIDGPRHLSSAIRDGLELQFRFINQGFRVARTLD
ncbi:MAG: formylglycine-generating enzyme family protein [Defluviicoccus sp.]|nr:formylglycine-generating enzyme family protein [Defluviicoccus sp.]MDG4610015.1 formylglycine-generating enzyme family protein [Defluviicoccus sp.]